MRAEKQLLLDEINDLIDHSKAMIVTKYEKFPPQLTWSFGEILGKNNCVLKVLKKRILYKAAHAKNISFNPKTFPGHIAVVFINGDALQATKAIVNFKKENEDLIQIMTGQIEGKACSLSEIMTLAELPSRDELRAQFLGLLEAPMAQTLSVMESLLTSVIYCLENKKS